MRILLVNTYDKKGGAAVACRRLYKALLSRNEKVKYAVREKTLSDENVIDVSPGFLNKKIDLFHVAWERFIFFFYEKSKEIRWGFSLGNTGVSIASNKSVREADVVHLHWVNQALLSLEGVGELLRTKKTVLWTLHDMWAFTGGCHYAGDCKNFMQECGNCQYVKSPGNNDISKKIWKNKLNLYENKDITFITCSHWLAGVAKQSSLLKDCRVVSIPNPIDTNLFKPEDKAAVRSKMNMPNDKFLILFGAMNVDDKRKGFAYFLEALNLLKEQLKGDANNVELLVFGKSNNETLSTLPFKVHDIGLLSDESAIAEVYSMADIFILPSLEDNLPNTVMESLSCGTPVVAFDTGGIPEMVDHKENGYLADYKSSDDLAKGIQWMFSNQAYNEISEKARNKVMTNFTFEIVAKQYTDLYKSRSKN